MKISVIQNEQHDCCEIRISDWVIIATGAEWEEGMIGQIKEVYNELDVNSFYKLLGFELHTQQQGQSEVYFKGMRVVTERIEDTCGCVNKDTVLLVATTRQPLGLLTQDYSL